MINDTDDDKDEAGDDEVNDKLEVIDIELRSMTMHFSED